MTPHQYDRSFIWHPYASLRNPPPTYVAKSAFGVEIETEDGSRLIDAVSSWWCVAHGHNHPDIVDAIRRQSERLCHVMFGGFTHTPAIAVAQRLAAITPPGFDYVFFADSGSIAVEVAAKMAVQYHYALGRPERNRFVALRGGYHGDTSLCMALSNPDGMHTLFKGIMTRHFFADRPTCPFGAPWRPDDAGSLARILEEHGNEIAAVVCEPVFQAANAMNFYHPQYLREAWRLCREHGVLLIVDEIAAGFYRTGPCWAHEHAGVTPDIMTVGKALTGGHLTLAAAVASRRVAETISNGNPSALMHGPTYMANPLACAAANASLTLFEMTDYPTKVANIERRFREGLAGVRDLPNVRDVRVLGATAVIETHRLPSRADIARTIARHGVWLRPFCNFIYAMPPLVSKPETIDRIVAAMADLAACPPDPNPVDGDFHE